MSGNCIIFITVLDVNDNVPIFEHSFYNISVNSSGEENETITAVAANDADSGLNSELSYSLIDNVQDQFEINEITGEIRRKVKSLKCNKDTCTICLPNICVISIEASDKGVPKLVGRTFLNVHLTKNESKIPLINIK